MKRDPDIELFDDFMAALRYAAVGGLGGIFAHLYEMDDKTLRIVLFRLAYGKTRPLKEVAGRVGISPQAAHERLKRAVATSEFLADAVDPEKAWERKRRAMARRLDGTLTPDD